MAADKVSGYELIGFRISIPNVFIKFFKRAFFTGDI